MGKVKATNEDKEEEKRRGGQAQMRMVKKQNRRNNRMVIFKKDNGRSHGVGGKRLQKEENASEKFSLEASLKQDVLESLSIKGRRKKTEKKEETERNPSLQSPPATDSEAGLCTQTSCSSPLLHPQQIQSSSVWFGPHSSSPDTAWMQPEVSAVFCRGHSLGLPHDTVRNLRSSHMAACPTK